MKAKKATLRPRSSTKGGNVVQPGVKPKADSRRPTAGRNPMIKDHHGAITFAVKVHPRAKRNAITGTVGDALKLSLTSPPLDGRANEACIEFFAKLFRVPRASVTIAAGEKSRSKVIRVVGMTTAAAQRIFGEVI